MFRGFLALAAVMLLLAAACGGDGDSSGDATREAIAQSTAEATCRPALPSDRLDAELEFSLTAVSPPERPSESRSYVIHIPRTYDGTKRYPVLLALHGA